MKTITLIILLAGAAILPASAQVSFTITLTQPQAVILTNAVEAANIAAAESYTNRLAEVAALVAAGDKFATNPPPPVVLTPALYVQGFAVNALGSTDARVNGDLANELKRRIDRLTVDERKALRRSVLLPNRP